jgi:hypothetical protein
MRLSPILGLAVLLAAAPLQAQQTGAPQVERRVDPFTLSASTGLDYSSGGYGLDEKTNILVIPFSLRAKTGSLSFSATIPYIRLDGPGGVVIGPGGDPLPGIPTGSGERAGFGDLSLGATYTIAGDVGGFELGLGARVKLPTSRRSEGLSTGETDLSVSADISYDAGSVAPFLNLGYRFLGDPEGLDLRNGPTASAGSTFRLGGKAVLVASYDYSRASSSLAEDAHELFGAVSAPVSERLNLTGYGVAGLSRGSPDFGLGMLLTARLF